MDWLSNLGLTESDLNFDTPEYCPQYPHKDTTGGNGVTFTEIENKNNFSKDEQAHHYSNGLPTYFFNGGDHHAYYGDANFIIKELARYPPALAKLIAVKYSQLYKQQQDSNLNRVNQDNLARRLANQYMVMQRQEKSRVIM